ncbi:MAG: hypothetical protein Q4G43_08280 [Mobilicoccus sp.]|nr:hypothetical protein [Mobilicoccus sp.]
MSFEDTLRTRLVDFVDHLDLDDAPDRIDDENAEKGGDERSGRPSRRAVLAGAAAGVAIVGGVAAAGGLRLPRPNVTPAAAPLAFPAELPRYSLWPRPLSWTGMQQAVLAYRHSDLEADFAPQQVVLSTDWRSTGRLGAARRRGDHRSLGRTILSPDGRRLAVGTSDEGDVLVLDVGASSGRTYPLTQEERAVVPQFFTTDGRTLFATLYTPGTEERYVALPGPLARIDLESGSVTWIADGVWAASPSADDTRLAVGYETSLSILDAATGQVLRGDILDVRGQALPPYAWSPDEQHIMQLAWYTYVDGEPTVEPPRLYNVTDGSSRVLEDAFVSGLCWLDAHTYIGTWFVPPRIVAVDIRTDTVTELTRWGGGGSSHISANVGEASIARDLVRRDGRGR